MTVSLFCCHRWPERQEARGGSPQPAATSWPSCQSRPDCLGVFWTVSTCRCMDGICPAGADKETDKCPTIVHGRIWWKSSIIIQLYADNAPTTPLKLLELKGSLERDLFARLATFSLSTSPLVKSEWRTPFFVSPNFSANWELSKKDTKSNSKPDPTSFPLFDNQIWPNLTGREIFYCNLNL